MRMWDLERWLLWMVSFCCRFLICFCFFGLRFLKGWTWIKKVGVVVCESCCGKWWL